MVKKPNWPVDDLCALLDHVLAETGLTQAGLAALVSIDPSQISRWRSGSARPRFEGLTALGRRLQEKFPALHVGPDQLLAAGGYFADYQPAPEARTDETSGPPVATRRAEQAGLSAIDLIRATVRAEFIESERRQREERKREREQVDREFDALREEIRRLQRDRVSQEGGELEPQQDH